MTCGKYRNRFVNVMIRLKLIHRPHKTRHIFITKAKECHIDEYIKTHCRSHHNRYYRKTYISQIMEKLHKEICKITK